MEIARVFRERLRTKQGASHLAGAASFAAVEGFYAALLNWVASYPEKALTTP
jgi:hypothetical protein